MKASELFENFPKHVDGWDDVRAVFSFEIPDAGAWSIAVDQGRTTVSTGVADHADVTIRTSEPVFSDLVTGRSNLLTAMLRGDLEAHGNRLLLKRLHGTMRAKRPS
jgi:putative sterol carrier protein